MMDELKRPFEVGNPVPMMLPLALWASWLDVMTSMWPAQLSLAQRASRWDARVVEKEQLTALRADIEVTQRNLEDAIVRVTSQRTEAERLAAACDVARVELQTIEGKLRAGEQSMLAMSSATKTQIADLESTTLAAEEARDAAQRQLTGLKQGVQTMQGETTRLTAACNNAKSELQTVQAGLRETEQTREAAKDQLTALQRDIKTSQGEAARLTAACNQAKSDLQTVQAELRETEQAREGAKDQLAALQRDVESAKRQVSELAAARNQAEDEVQRMREQVQVERSNAGHAANAPNGHAG
jgi:chromosome segregation ATPase